MPAHCSQEERWDHDRDHRKNYIEDETGPIALRLQPKLLSTAMDVALIVQRLTNLQEAGRLIDAYADAKAAEIRLDAVAAGAGR